MSKLFSSIFLASIFVLIVWALLGWFFGEASEKTFKVYLQQDNQVVDNRNISYQLISYRKTLLGAKGKIELAFNSELLSDTFGQFTVNFTMLNGPIFINKAGISSGKSRWILKIDDSSLSDNQKDRLQALFPKALPVFEVLIDFNNRAHYLSRAITLYAKMLLTGVFDLETEDNRGAVKLTNFLLKDSAFQLSAKNIQLSFQHQKAITKHYKPGTSSVSIPELKLAMKSFKSPEVIDLKINADIRQENNSLSGFVKAKIKNKSSQIPYDLADLSIYFNDISRDGFVAWSDLNSDLQNLHQQVGWTLEENGEYPEGQDQIWQLYDQIDLLSSRRVKLLSTVFAGNNHSLNFDAKIKSAAGNSTIKGLIKVSKTNKKLTSFLSFLKGKADVNVMDDLYLYLKNKIALKKKHFKLVFEGNKLLIHQ